MSIDTLSPNKINIKELAFTEPTERQYIFNPGKIITPELFRRYKEKLSWSDNSDERKQYAMTATELVILFPEKRGELGLPKSPNDFVVEQRPQPKLDANLNDLKVLYPDQVDDDFLVSLPKTSFAAHKHFIDIGVNRNRNIWECFMLYPDRMHEIVSLPDLDHKIEADMIKWKGNDWLNFLINATAFKLLHPDKKIDLTDSDWRGIEETLLHMRNDEEIDSLSFFTARAKIVASENIEMMESGLVINMPKPKFQNADKIMPGARKF